MPSDPDIIQQWSGINERVDPLLLPDDVYASSEGVVYRAGMGCRVYGKQLTHKFTTAICNIAILNSLGIIQTLGAVYSFNLNDLFIQPLPSGSLQVNPGGEYIQNDPQGNYMQPNS